MKTNNKQQTAVEWLYIELSKFLNGKSEFTHKSDILIKAKEMEKEQIMQSLNDGKSMALNSIENKSLEQYYHATYGGGEQ